MISRLSLKRRLLRCLWLVLAVCMAMAFFVLPVFAVDWDLESDTWVATDALGRKLSVSTDAGVGAPKYNKTVGIFYFLWLERNSWGPFDITKLLAANTTNPAWGPRWSFHHWGESELGYYTSDDSYVIRKHCQMLVDAGVDVLCFDVTNGVVNTYTDKYMNLCAVFQQIRNEGGKTPQICFVVNTESAQVVQKLYDDFYSKNLYPDLWFSWLGRPLMLAPPDGLSSTLLNFFTLRKTWAWNTGVDNWNFMDKYPQNVGYHTSPSTPEEVAVAVAEHPGSNIGRSCQAQYNSSTGKWTTVGPVSDQYFLCPTKDQGLYFAQQWSRVGTGTGQVSPPFVFVTGWNEWVAQRFIEGLDYTTLSAGGHPLSPGDTYFVDAFTQEYSRDIEPMKSGHTDNYYYQLISGIRKYKGAKPTIGPGLSRTIMVDGLFADWLDAQPEYRDTIGDTEYRNSVGYAYANIYTNTTGRNDFVKAKVARDTDYIYFYCETNDNITNYTDSNWMMLYIDSDSNAATGWQGYDYAINVSTVDSTKTTLWQNAGGWNWNLLSSNIDYRVAGNQMEIAVPRSAIGKAGTANVALDFHWADNSWDEDVQPGDVTGFFLNGDSAPNRRFNYRYDTSVVGPPWEFESGLESWTSGRGISGLTAVSGSMQGTSNLSNPYANAPSTAGVNADVYRYIRVSMKHGTASANTAEIRFKSLANATYGTTRAVSLPITCDNAYHTYIFDMSKSAEWKGWVYALQLHPTEASGVTFYVEYIRALPDTSKPSGTVIISSSQIPESGIVSLALSAADSELGVSKMRLSNDNVTWSAWENYATSKDWELAPGDGLRTVYAQFRDRHFNVSDVSSVSIQVDSSPPVGTVSINSNGLYVNSSQVTLTLSATDYNAVSQMRFSNDHVNWTAWEDYATSKAWTLPSGEGVRTVYAQFSDTVGHLSDTASASAIVDLTAPYGTTAINNGDLYATVTAASLILEASDDSSGVADMRLGSDGSTWGDWEPFASSKFWTLTPGDGEKTVYAQFRDTAGNISDSIAATITLDTENPTTPGTPSDAGAFTATTSVVFNWTAATDSGSGVASYICEIGTTPGGSDVFSGNVADALSWTVTGIYGKRYYCRVKAQDQVGNSSAWSANSDGIAVVQASGITISEAKDLADTASIGLSAKAVTAVFGNRLYIEESDRYSGIMVQLADAIPAGLAVGSLVDVGGVLTTNSDQERWLDATVKLLTGSANILPIAMSNRSVGGGNWNYYSSPVRGQKGVDGSSGLNNIGLLIKSYGVVTSLDTNNFCLNDGSGVTVKVTVPAGVTVPVAGSYVGVTGVSSCYLSGSSLNRLLLARSSSDVVTVK